MKVRTNMIKKQYYDISNLLKTKAQYMILLGQRANGKSYQAKKTVLEAAYSSDQIQILMLMNLWRNSPLCAKALLE